ncbi:TPA: hypothetical protein ACX13R_001029 [Citrobacter amalonaticus]
MTITDTNKSVMVGVTSGKEEKAGWRIWLVMGNDTRAYLPA